ncbi:MAG: hypothetical protein ACI96M_001748 [Candidatus Azotimanducaceae bacterium]|jgi:hypothetical protein
MLSTTIQRRVHAEVRTVQCRLTAIRQFIYFRFSFWDATPQVQQATARGRHCAESFR